MNSRRSCASCGARGSSRHHALSAPSLRRDDSLPPLVAAPGAAPFDALGAGCTELLAEPRVAIDRRVPVDREWAVGDALVGEVVGGSQRCG